MTRILLDESKCTLCMLCVEYCPAFVFTLREGRIVVEAERCVECYACEPLCPAGAVKVVGEE
ncbi:indolepyruvate ferredoxin oxidoreductase subunit alpha [Desulfurococcus mucosus]|uniref:4Fe-4S ferredoxin-type domain-containing protein n=1 Tax=Desulfurococcus mucosus (strain ATCC 35584 / DSM 2162 / JCM 9187 / O7/1) TaxID=765177 RepID=E8RA63_DESM0|nr:4Fe-4S binding protein [Desulfurococcus mucosus]ADV65369.1 protein of unknown function DUF362 [Desulfurococcus mucosus DSM 2162]